ncbi:unnamed protein product [Didymodactylos carnosus]|uniref:Uncharacterized protein n=1 Tax=Didymodactylos carnosus TaxID=1234261 RepID=A0A8S2GD27_9BILA|nr:unnamed protein product [Didymodactylos carnosus]CAF3494986.1 unnamed protein product [Didymodactylos carnosus]
MTTKFSKVDIEDSLRAVEQRFEQLAQQLKEEFEMAMRPIRDELNDAKQQLNDAKQQLNGAKQQIKGLNQKQEKLGEKHQEQIIIVHTEKKKELQKIIEKVRRGRGDMN